MTVTINGSGAISGLVIGTADLADSSVTTAKIAASAVATADIADSAVTTAKLADANVTIAKLSATGTANNTTYLRGDNTWQVVSTTPTTAQVLSATAGASAGAVGTYAFATHQTAGSIAAGGTIAGSNLRYYGISSSGAIFSGTPAGTWRCMGYVDTSATGTVWLRIS